MILKIGNIDISLLISIISATFAGLTLLFNVIINFYKSRPHLKIIESDDKYSGVAIGQNYIIEDEEFMRSSGINTPYNSCIMAEFTLINNSSNPIVIMGFTSNGLKNMQSKSHNYGFSCGLTDPKIPEYLHRTVNFFKDDYFKLPLTIMPYQAKFGKVQLMCDSNTIKQRFANKTHIKINLIVSRRRFIFKKTYSTKITINNFRTLVDDNTTKGADEHDSVNTIMNESVPGDVTQYNVSQAIKKTQSNQSNTKDPN